MNDRYRKFLQTKRKLHGSHGFQPIMLNSNLMAFQKHSVEWAIKKGRAAIFSDCGTGKTFMQLEWARAVHEHTGKPVLILAPLAVSQQTEREGRRWGIKVSVMKRPEDLKHGIGITNYEKLKHFGRVDWAGIVLDESSILKSYTGKFRNQILESFASTPFKLACTATPSPNDYMELGNHSEFLGVMTRTAMLSTYFNHDGGETSKWKLKGHAVTPFWEWVASWALMYRYPSDIGYPNNGFVLPELRRHYHIVSTPAQEGYLFPVEASSLSERRESRKVSIDKRADLCADMVNGSADQWIVWGDLNAETEAAAEVIPDAIEVAGRHSEDHKENTMLGFADGDPRVLVTKGKIAGFGMNWQNCHKVIRMGLTDSYELMYQEERRCWRFGQKHPVDVHVFISDRDEAVVRNIDRKRAQADEMAAEMMEAMKSVR